MAGPDDNIEAEEGAAKAVSQVTLGNTNVWWSTKKTL